MIPLKNLSALRFISMIGIVFVHSIMVFSSSFFNDKHVFIGSQSNFLFYSFLVNLGKFATIIFFIISGYLFEVNRLKYTSFRKFIGNKYRKLLLPYIIIFFIPIVITSLPMMPFSTETETVTFGVFWINIIKKIFLSNYWFIPVLFVYFILNFYLPYKYIKIAFPVSVAITLFYAANLYHPIIPTSHTLSILGFCSFFFIGRMMATAKASTFSSYSLPVAIVLFIVALIVSNVESWVLYFKVSDQDAWNTLKLSNILYAFAILFLLKDRIEVPKKLLATDTYFIYLFHPHLKRLYVFFFSFLESKGLILSHSNLMILGKTIVFVLLCYGAERIYTKAKSSSLHINFYKPSFWLRKKSYHKI